MSQIYIYSPSSAIEDKASFQRGVKRLRALGHEVELDADTLGRHQRFAGDDATRIAAISRAAASGADIAMITGSPGFYPVCRTPRWSRPSPRAPTFSVLVTSPHCNLR